MKKRSFALMMLCLLACWACGDKRTDMGLPDAGAPDSGEQPDLCTPSSPCALMSGIEASEFIAPVGDEDRWAFDVPSPNAVLNVSVRNDVDFSRIRLQVVIFGPDNQALQTEGFNGNGKQVINLQLRAKVAGRHAVLVRDVGNDAADPRNPYHVKVTVLSETDNNEPNDRFEEAQTLAPGQTASGVIGAQGDEDWFKFDVPADNLVRVEMSVAPRNDSAVRFRWELFKDDGTTRIAESNEPLDQGLWPAENRAVGNEAGTYYLKVIDLSDDGRDADLERIYGITVTFSLEPDVQDLAAPNETPTTPTTIQAGVPVTGYIAASSDLDYYLINVPGASSTSPRLIVVEATMAGPSPVDLAFTVLGTDRRTEICDARDGDSCRALRFVSDGQTGAARLRTSHVVTAAGNYAVVVRDFQDNEFDTATSYQLRVTLPAEPDPNETYKQDQRMGAVPVVASSTAGTTIVYPWVEGYISHANDEDWYRFDIPGNEDPNLPAGQNGDWLIELALEMGVDGPQGQPGTTPVELEAFFFGPNNSYGGYGKRCREPTPSDTSPCQYPEAQNPIQETFGENHGDCFVVFRERTNDGAHYFRFSDLDRDDFDISNFGRYRFQVRLTAKCPSTSRCMGVYTGPNGDLCGRP